MSKNLLIGFLILCLVAIGTLLFIVVEEEPLHGNGETLSQSNLTGVANSENNINTTNANLDQTNDIEERVSGIESQISNLSHQIGQLSSLIKDSVERKVENPGREEAEEEQSEAETLATDLDETTPLAESDIDPFSPEGIALENEIQNRYVTQIDDLFQAQQLDDEWAAAVESEVLPALSNLDAFATGQPSSNQEINIPQNNLPDISVSQFTCRSQLCSMEVIAGSESEMIAYQGFMVNQTKASLPSIIFSTIEPYGNKFRMQAFLGNDDFEFPSPNE